MKRQARCRQAKGPTNISRRQPSGPKRDEQSDQVKSRLMGEGGQGGQGFTSLHTSTTHETLNYSFVTHRAFGINRLAGSASWTK